jgi:FAD:protein FMN transferase
VSRVRSLVVAMTLLAPPAGAAEVREAHYVMGTVLEVTIETAEPEHGRSALREAVGVARALDRELTTFDAESPLSRFNRAAGTGEREIPADLFRVLAEARVLWKASRGIFDPTVGPLLRVWSDAKRANRLPTADEVDAARVLVGFDGLRLLPPARAALDRAGMSIDLGGIGKGYAVDRMVDRMRELGVAAALVNFGESSIRALGAPVASGGWEVWIRRGRQRLGPLRLRDVALSTSRSLARPRSIAGTRVGDVLDPRSGRPVTSDCQATVRARTATEAEAWSKVLLVEPSLAFTTFESRGDLAGFLACPDGVRASPLLADLARN